MVDKINISDIHQHNINFLIGSGASVGLFPTLSVAIKDEGGKDQTIETLATMFENKSDDNLLTLLFMHYYKTCIQPAMKFDLEKINQDAEIEELFGGTAKEKVVIENYKKFINTLLTILQRRENSKRRCNIFTTNYDGCLAHVADQMMKQGNIDFIINDGTRGFSKRYLHAKNFNSFVFQTGIFEQHQTDIPQINLIHLHGSVYWYKDAENIRVDYSSKNEDRLIEEELFDSLEGFSEIVADETKTTNDLDGDILSDDKNEKFWESYRSLPIVNPTKWKFHETVFEEHYYQMLRLLSYELEKPNSVFITFGFSFADEHILNLVKRSLSNPSLQIFICCFNEVEKEKMQKYFQLFKNVVYISIDDNLDFTAFNEYVFTLLENSDGAEEVIE